MNTSEIIRIAYSGERVNAGEMDINDLAPALLAFSDLIGECNKILNQDNSKIQVKIKADFQQGSFEITLDIIRSISEKFMALFQARTMEIGELLNLIGIGASVSGINLLEIIRWVRGRKISKITNIDKDTVKIEIENEEREFSVGAFQLFKSRKVREYVQGILTPLQKDGIDAFEVRDKDNHTAIQRIDKDEQDYFCADIDSDIQEIISTKTSLVHIISINFEEGLKWRFDDGSAKFYANIKDEEFIKNVQASNIAFKKGDILEVEMTTTQRTDGKSIKTTFDIIKVNRILNNEQIELNFGNEDETE